MACQRIIKVIAASIIAFASANADETPAILRGPETEAAIRYKFSPDDEKLLDEIQRGCFLYFWKEVGEPAQLAKDRLKAPVASIAAIGFQLSSLPIGVERGWITRDEGAKRAEIVLRSLIERDDNKRFGVYLHFPDMNTGGLSHVGFEILAGTVDHALLVAGAMPAASYFGGEVARLTDRMIRDTDWRALAVNKEGFISMGWKPDVAENLAGSGKFLDYHWWVASDEERLVYFLAAAAPEASHAVAPEMYYRLKRVVKKHEGGPQYAVSWPGTLFTYFFSHCWIDYRSLGADDPSRFGVDAPRVDWFENSRRAVLTQRSRCADMASKFRTFALDRWGLSSCAARDGYIVPEIMPNIRDHDDCHEGTIAPYAAGSAIMFAPQESLAALRAFRNLKGPDGQPFVWRDPSAGGYGFVDSFNLEQGYACDDYVGIDQGPMLLAIENARTGLIWKLFMQHENAQRAVERLKLKDK